MVNVRSILLTFPRIDWKVEVDKQKGTAWSKYC